ncbi:MAG: C10 family peptidase [Odoribacter sp.]
MKITIYLFTLCMFFLSSCNKNEMLTQNTSDNSENSNTSKAYNVPYDDVLQAAEMAIDILEQNQPQTKSNGQKRKIGKVNLIANTSKTRATSNEATSNIYIVNFENNMGYTIISGDKRTPSILAIIENGHLEKIDATSLNDNDCPSIAKSFLLSLPEYINIVITQNEQKKNISINQSKIKTRTLRQAGGYERWTARNTVGPMLKTKWAQEYPFNEKHPLATARFSCNHHAIAGCVSIALGQLMSYYKWPQNYNGVNYSWSDAVINCVRNTSDPTVVNEVSSLTHEICAIGHAQYGGCDKYDCANSAGTKYSLNANESAYVPGTSIYQADISSILTQMGYQHSNFQTYNTQDVIATVKNNIPVLSIGLGSGFHAWIIDGYSDFTRYRYYDGWMYESTDFSLIHCNFGWGGQSNGYYTSEVFDTCHPMYPDSDKNNHYDPETGNHIGYKYNLQTINNITPIR